MAKKKSIIEEAKEIVENVAEAVEETAEKIAKKAKKVEKEIVKDVKELVEDNSKKETKISKLEELKKKAAKLAGDVKELEDVNLKSKIKPEETTEKKDMLIPIEDYLKASIHLGTRVITPDMKSCVYRRRADGLAVFNTALLDDKLREGAEYLAQFAPGEITLVCKREAGWKAAKMFSEITGIRVFTKKYPAGVLTNTKLENFFETELVFTCDPWLDKNALTDANRIGIPVLSICDTNNYTQGITKIIPGNNKSNRSIGIIFYLLAKLYCEKRKIKANIPEIKEWIDNWENLEAPK